MINMLSFRGLVFGSNIHDLLEPYNWHNKVQPYIKFTKEEAIDRIKQHKVEIYEHAMSILGESPDNVWIIPKRTESAIIKAKWIFNNGIGISYNEAWKEAKTWGYKIDNNNLISEINPNAKWWRYTPGGCYMDWLKLKIPNEKHLHLYKAIKKEIDWEAMINSIPFCFITEDGIWHDSFTINWWDETYGIKKGSYMWEQELALIGWWRPYFNYKDKQEWKEEFKIYLDSVRDDILITVIDFNYDYKN